MLAVALAALLLPSAVVDRPRDVWVFRSVLDGRPRVVTLALHNELWAAYDATHCGLVQAWKGGVHFDGAVYTTSHGPQPTSEGTPYSKQPVDRPVWALEAPTGMVRPKFGGYRIEGERVTFRYLFRSGSREMVVEESPEVRVDEQGVRLVREFELSGADLGQPRLWTHLDSEHSFDGLEETAREGDLVQYGFVDRRASLTHFFDPKGASDLADLLASAAPQPPDSGLMPGLALRLYDVGEPMDALPMLVAGQTPNVSTVTPTVDLRDADFGGLKDRFLAVLTGWLRVPEGGEYTFRLTSDDGSRLTIADQRVIDHDGLHGSEPRDATLELTEGLHPILIEHFENDVDARLLLEWKRPGRPFAVVPSSSLATLADEVRVTAPGLKKVMTRNSLRRPGDGRPLTEVHPSYALAGLRPAGFEPRVGGLAFLPDGRLAVCTWDPDGAVYLLDGVLGLDPKPKLKRIAFGLAEPLGLTTVGDRLFVLQKQELTELVDHDGDDVIDEYRCIADSWGVTSNFHEFAFGLVEKDGFFYGNLAIAIDPGGRSTQPQNPDRGKVMKIGLDGSVEFVASGLRTPNGIGFGPGREVFITDNQGDWLPSSKLLHLEAGDFYGSRAVDPVGDKDRPEIPPVAWLPQGEIGNSPSQVALLEHGPYAGQLVHGDVTHGGLKRVQLEKVNGRLQGTVFRFTQGLEAGVNRVILGPDGAFYVGGIGSTGNWGQTGKLTHGLQKLSYTGAPAFEMLAVRPMRNGLEVDLTEPLARGFQPSPEDLELESWRYVPTVEYGGPKVDERTHVVKSVSVQRGRRTLFIQADGLEPGRVWYLRLDAATPSASGRLLWSTEAWSTVNAIPNRRGRVTAAAPSAPNTLTPEERRQGFELLFDGESLAAWRGFKRSDVPGGWSAADGELRFTPGGDGGDLVTREAYRDFDLRLEWRVAPGGNSGVFFHVSEDGFATWASGPEMQVLDDERHPDGQSPLTSAGSNYALHGPTARVARPAGKWNSVRLVVRNGHVEHWLNGHKVVEYTLGSPEWTELVRAGKFADLPLYGKTGDGLIALQDHGDRVSYRNIRIRRL